MGITSLGHGAYVKFLQQMPWLRKTHNIYESDWDILVVLDACRPDLLSAVSPD